MPSNTEMCTGSPRADPRSLAAIVVQTERMSDIFGASIEGSLHQALPSEIGEWFLPLCARWYLQTEGRK